MKIEQAIRFLPLLLILIFQSGCMTHMLWTNGDLDAVREPNSDPNLRIFKSEQTNVFLSFTMNIPSAQSELEREHIG